MHEGEREK
jgi:centrosomal protein CEP76